MPKDRALNGVRILETGSFYSAAYCAKLLGGLGAEVTKVEPPTGDCSRRYGPFPGDVPDTDKSGLFWHLNTGKRGITLDIENPTGRELLLRLVAKYDVLVDNNLPMDIKRWGLTYDAIQQVNPGLVMTTVTPFGYSGPYSDYKAGNLEVCAAAGACRYGLPDREPLKPAGYQAHAQGGVHAAAATVTALLARLKDGLGQHVDISEATAWATFHNLVDIYSHLAGASFKRSGYRRTDTPYPHTTLPCKDGYVMLIAVQGRQWKTFLELIGDGKVPEWYAQDPRFKDRFEVSRKYADELDQRISGWLMAHTKEEIFSLCHERAIPFAPVYTVADLVDQPHLHSRGFFSQIEQPGAGVQTQVGAPFQLSETPWSVTRPAPRLGQHNDDVFRAELGLARSELVQLRQTAVI